MLSVKIRVLGLLIVKLIDVTVVVLKGGSVDASCMPRAPMLLVQS